jgi:hypothetical protein
MMDMSVNNGRNPEPRAGLLPIIVTVRPLRASIFAGEVDALFYSICM